MKSLFARIEKCYKGGRPLYVKDATQTAPTKESIFKIISEAQFVNMEVSEVQQILRKQHIVITDKRYKEQSFQQALLDVAALDWVTSIQGANISPFEYHYWLINA